MNLTEHEEKLVNNLKLLKEASGSHSPNINTIKNEFLN